MKDKMKKVLDEKEGIQDFTKGKVQEYSPEKGAQACIDEVNLLLEFLEDDYLHKCVRLKELRDHLAEIFVE